MAAATIETATSNAAHDDHDGQFQTVNRTKPRKNRKAKHRQPEPKNLVTLVHEHQAAIRSTGYAEHCKRLLEESWQTTPDGSNHSSNMKRIKRCVCFGLGSLRNSPKSQLQLALLQELLPSFELTGSVIMVEPAFDAEDEVYLRSEGYEIEEYKDEFLKLSEPTFLFMPHCPRFLYEKLLELNRDCLGHLLLLGNPLTQYAEREFRSEELEKIPRLREIGNTLVSIDLPEYESRPDAFNDTAWQWLRRDRSETSTEASEFIATQLDSLSIAT